MVYEKLPGQLWSLPELAIVSRIASHVPCFRMKPLETITIPAHSTPRGKSPGFPNSSGAGVSSLEEDFAEEPAPVGQPRDERWDVIDRIAHSDTFQKSARLSSLLRYLAVHSIAENRIKLTEQAIGRAVLGKSQDYTPAEDSSVRVYIRQLRLRLHEYYDGPGRDEQIVVSVPKGGYALAFQPRAAAQGRVELEDAPQLLSPGPLAVSSPAPASPRLYQLLILALSLCCAAGWYRAFSGPHPALPWPLASVVHEGSPTIIVLADAGFVLRMLGDEEIPLDRYISRTYLAPLMPPKMSDGEASVLSYMDTSRLTSVADAQAVGALAAISGQYAGNLVVRSARDLNANDLSHGDLIFIGSKTSNPWVGLYDQWMNFQIHEDRPHGQRYVINRKPLPGEKAIYQTDSMGTLASGEDYAVIASLPGKNGSGNVLILEGVRMEGTEAAIALLRNKQERQNLQEKLAALNGGRPPLHFEALLHAQSVAGVNVSVDFAALRILP